MRAREPAGANGAPTIQHPRKTDRRLSGLQARSLARRSDACSPDDANTRASAITILPALTINANGAILSRQIIRNCGAVSGRRAIDIMGSRRRQLVCGARCRMVLESPQEGGTIGSDNADTRDPTATIAVGRHQYQRDQRGNYKNLNYETIGDYYVAQTWVDSSTRKDRHGGPQRHCRNLSPRTDPQVCFRPLRGMHVMVEYFKVVTGTDMVFVPYKGGPALLPDLLGGRI